MNWSDASISEKAIRLVAIAIGTIFLRYQISLDEGTVFDVILMISAWCLLLAGMFLFRAKKTILACPDRYRGLLCSNNLSHLR